MTKNLVIVESPAKAKTIEGFLGKDFQVKSSFGHVMDLSKKNLGVDISNGFIPNYEIDPDKKKLVTELKKLARESSMVWLASDEDREGEAIAWHLASALSLEEEKTRRIVFHEITKPAILEAIENPRAIDKNLVDAQQARRVLDRLVGFELSPILWKKVKPALSAGRVQSVAVRLVVEREDEIRAHKVVSSFRVTAIFQLKEGKAKLPLEAELNKRFSTKEEALTFLERCIPASFTVADTEIKPAKKSPSPPFTTSTLQQEASRKLGFSVANTMRVAQQLYESGKITYMRTDSVHLSDLALNQSREEITSLFGKEYLKIRQYTTQSKGAQEAHEAIRPTYLQNRTIEGDNSQKRLYDLIWKRTIASQMSDALLEKTNITIDISGAPEKFIARGEVLKFDGFLKVYMESSDEEDNDAGEGVLPAVSSGENLNLKTMNATQKFTQHPPRFTEASLVKKLEELGIGRPSTYAPTISTILKRGYIVKEDRPGTKRDYFSINLESGVVKEEVKTENTGYEKAKLFPTDIGTLVNNFLMEHFTNILDYNFTATVEEEFDEIALGKKVWNTMIREFYHPFHEQVEKTMKTAGKVSGEKLLGQEPGTGENVYVKIGRFGPMIKIGEAAGEVKPRFASLLKGQSMEDISLATALELFKLPRLVGSYEGQDVTVAVGRFGPYLKHKSIFCSLPKGDDPLTVTIERGIELIEENRKKKLESILREFPEDKHIRILKGRWGAYISADKKNFRIPKNTDPETLTLEDCKKIIGNAPATSGKKSKPVKKNKSS